MNIKDMEQSLDREDSENFVATSKISFTLHATSCELHSSAFFVRIPNSSRIGINECQLPGT